VAGTCSDQVFVDHADINNNVGYTNLLYSQIPYRLNVKHSRQPHLREAYILVRSYFACHMTSDPRQIGTGPPVIQGQNKNFGSKKSHFHFKNRELFLQNRELKKIDSQSRLLLRQISHGVSDIALKT
jgi:hypothetical protein